MKNFINKLELDNKKILLIILVFSLVLYLDFGFVMRIQQQGIKNSQSKIIRLKKDMDSLARDLALLQQSKTKEDALLRSKKFILEEEIPSLLHNISNVAKKNDVRIMQMVPSKESRGKEEKSSKETAEFLPLWVRLDLYCNYHHLGKFINELENAQLFIAVQDVKITSEPTDYLKQKANLTLKTYVKK